MDQQIEQIVDELLFELYRRNGFDNWWDSLDADIKAEIKEAMTARARELYRTFSSFSIQGNVTGLVQGKNVAVTMDFGK